MSKKHSSPVSKTQPRQKQWPRAAIITIVVLLIGALLVLKGATDDPADQARNTATATRAAVGSEPATTVPVTSASPAPATTMAEELPATLLQQALTAGKPTFAFFHSNNCKQCILMMKVVEEVYPEFADSVVLVDVNVYDERNMGLLQLAKIHAIPTQIFFNSSGEGQTVLGAMTPDSFRTYLKVLAGEQ